MFKAKLNKLKTWFASKNSEEKIKLFGLALSTVAAGLHVAVKINDLDRARTWKREVKRREQLNK